MQQPEFEMTSGRDRTDHDMCIVSCGIGTHYQEPLHSTRLHCQVNVPEAWRLFYRELPLGCPDHFHSNYAFKLWAIRRAIEAGFRYVLWMDTSFQPIASIEPLWAVIREQGWYCAPQAGEKLGQWSSDACLDLLSLRRDDAMRIPLVYSGLFGFDVKSPVGAALWRGWQHTQAMGAWEGPHLNVPGTHQTPWGLKTQGHASHDPAVKGHRHDEAGLSYVLHQAGLTPVDRGFLTLESEQGFIGHMVELVVPVRASLAERQA